VTYPFAVVARRAETDGRARTLLAFLTGSDTEAVWQRFGFSRAGQ